MTLRAGKPRSDDTGGRIRVGAVSYLNTKPLVYQLQQIAPQVDLSFDLPSRLADDLAARRLDVALIPSVESFQNPDYSIVSDACIACRGPVLSVKLLSRCEMNSIRSLALDEGSRTSAALVQILLRQRFGISPRLEPLPMGANATDADTDAVLVIGDRAIRAPSAEFVDVWDLGEQWCRWAKLPFVFAMWVARPGVRLGDLAGDLASARDLGVKHLEEIAAEEAGKVGLSPAECLAYLRDNLHFDLGSGERAGLRLFQGLAEEITRPFDDSDRATSLAASLGPTTPFEDSGRATQIRACRPGL